MKTVNLVTLTNAHSAVLFVVPPSFMEWASGLPMLFMSEEPSSVVLPATVHNDLAPFVLPALERDCPIAISAPSAENDVYGWVSKKVTTFEKEADVMEYARSKGWAVKGDEFWGRLG